MGWSIKSEIFQLKCSTHGVFFSLNWLKSSTVSSATVIPVMAWEMTSSVISGTNEFRVGWRWGLHFASSCIWKMSQELERDSARRRRWGEVWMNKKVKREKIQSTISIDKVWCWVRIWCIRRYLRNNKKRIQINRAKKNFLETLCEDLGDFLKKKKLD